MATEDRTTEDGRRATNVVPFPGDWIGPREELVPVVPASAKSLSGDDDAPPLAPDAFWSEHSDAIHDVLRAPAPAPPPEHRVRGRGPWVAVRGALASAVARAPRPTLPALRPRLPPVRYVAGLGAAGALIALAVAVVPTLVSSRAEPRQHFAAVAEARSRESPGSAQATAPVGATQLRQGDAAGRRAVRVGPRRVAMRPRGRPARSRHGRTVTSGIFVNDKVAPSWAGGGQTGSSWSPSINPGGSRAAGSAAEAAGGTGSPASPGPVGPGAPFGPGQLG